MHKPLTLSRVNWLKPSPCTCTPTLFVSPIAMAPKAPKALDPRRARDYAVAAFNKENRSSVQDELQQTHQGFSKKSLEPMVLYNLGRAWEAQVDKNQWYVKAGFRWDGSSAKWVPAAGPAEEPAQPQHPPQEQPDQELPAQARQRKTLLKRHPSGEEDIDLARNVRQPITQIQQWNTSFKNRRRGLRLALEHAAGSDDASDVTRVLMVSLSKEEKTDILQALAKEHQAKEPCWLELGQQLARSLLAMAHRKFTWPARLLASVLRSCGHRSRTKIQSMFDLILPKKQWKQSEADQELPTYVHQAADNGRLGFRKCPRRVMQEVLAANTVDSCQTVVGRGRGRGHEYQEDVPLQTKKVLTDTARQVFMGSDEFKISIQTFYRNLKKDHPEVGKGKAR